MSRFSYSQRSKEAPMDYEWTNRPGSKPAWSASDADPHTPKKRSFTQANPATPVVGVSGPPTFGQNQGVPFLFNPAPLPEPQGYPWAPPPQFSPSKAFPQPEIHDVDMNDASPAKDEKGLDSKESEHGRPVAAGALRRVYNKRRRNLTRSRTRQSSEDHDDSGLGSGTDDEVQEDRVARRSQRTSNHYTLNLPAHPPQVSETPYILLGYLQFFFNLSLVLLFLYLVVQFILTVQRDVEKRIIEVSQDALQEIAMCATQYKKHFCGTEYVGPSVVGDCANWETCMNRDPTTIGRAKVSAELIAQVINGFVEPISWKTLIFTLTSLAFLTVFINTLLSLYRSRYQPHTAPLQPAASYPVMPNAPYPSHAFGGFLPSAPTSNWGRFKNGDAEDHESPARRRRLEGGASAKIK